MSRLTRVLYRSLVVVVLTWFFTPLESSALESGVTTLVSTGACWRVHDRGADLGTDWIYFGTDDSAWSRGPAELGYGDGDEATVVSFGPNPGNKFITTYFRHEFNVPSPTAFSSLRLRVKRDDGVAIYLNGVQVYRNNLTPVANYLTLAALATNDGTNFLTTTLSPTLLLPEKNVLAVEMHQFSATDPDISFDLDLVGLYTTNTTSPALAVAKVTANQFVVSWPNTVSSNFMLQASSQLAPANWSSVSNSVAVVSGHFYVTNTLTTSPKFFRLAWVTANVVPCQPPLVLAQPLEVFAPAGTNILLSLTVTGTPPISYQWFHNTFPVPGGTSPTLLLTNVQRTDGGRYELCMAGSCDTGFSEPIGVIVGGTSVAMTDALAARPVFSDFVAEINSSNQLASAEIGEPAILGHPAERSMWLSYQAPADGVVTFTTAGSSFDTLLAAYHVDGTGALNLIDEDDDHGPTYTSLISFAVTNGESVEVKVDNYPGGAGAFQLGWNLVPTNAVVPLILTQPQSQIVTISNNFTVFVTAINPGSTTALTYQWQHNGTNIIGATNSSLTVLNVQAPDTGLYDVTVSNGGNSKRSQSANLALNSGGITTGRTITVTGAAKRRKCSTYLYAAPYTNTVIGMNGYFQIMEPLQLKTWVSLGGAVVNYPAQATRFEESWVVCTATRTQIDMPTPVSQGPFNYLFEIVVPAPTTFYVDYAPYP